jgi:hypothetical protein
VKLLAALLAALGVAFAAPGAVTQDLPPLAAGQRVRVTASAADMSRQTATLVALSAESLVVARWWPGPGGAAGRGDSGAVRIALGAVRALDVSAGRRRHTVLGIVIGGLVGGTARAIYGFSQGDTSDVANFVCDHVFPCVARTAGQKALFWGLNGMFGGALVGGVVGTFVKTERWIAVPLQRVRVSGVVLPGGRVGVGAAVWF